MNIKKSFGMSRTRTSDNFFLEYNKWQRDR